MIFDYMTLKVIWWGIITLVLIAFAITGGMDLGVNVLLPILGKNDEDRRFILNATGPTWEGNQVWLVTFGAALFAIWPDVYATSFSGLYFALLLALFMLILRPPGFDYRAKIDSHRWRAGWDLALFVGGVILTLVFGVAIGNLFIGLPFNFDADMRLTYAGGLLDLFSPLPLLFGLVSLSLLTLQGGLFLQYKLDDSFTRLVQKIIHTLGIVFFVTFIAAGFYSGLKVPGFQIDAIGDINTNLTPVNKTVSLVLNGWLKNYTKHGILWIFPILSVICVRIALRLSQHNKPVLGLLSNSIGIACAVLTAAVALFPFIIPSTMNINHSLTVWDSSSSALTLQLSLWAVIILLPIVLLYTAWVYRVMRGKVQLHHNSY